MKIAIDAREMVGAIAGKGRYVVELVKALAEIDTTNHYYLYMKQPHSLDLAANFETVIIGGKKGLRQLWMANDIKHRGCAVLLAPTGYLPIVFSKIPSVVTIHDLALFVSPYARPALKTLIAERLLLGLAARRSAHVLAVSESTKQDLMNLFTVAAKKITVTPLGYDKSLYTAHGRNDTKVLEQLKLEPDYLLFIGTLEPRKNIVGIIEAYSQLPEALQQQYPLVIGGKKGWFYEEIFAKVTQLKLEKKVRFLGRVEDEQLPALYRNAKLFLFPSFYEGFGLPPLEALACGTPVVSSNLSSLPEVVGEAGKLVDPVNTDQLTLAIRQLLEDTKQYETLAARTVAQASQFDWQETAKATLAVLKTAGRSNE